MKTEPPWRGGLARDPIEKIVPPSTTFNGGRRSKLLGLLFAHDRDVRFGRVRIVERRVALKVVFLVEHFPSVSETFILNQITGLLDQGHDVKIVSLRRPKTSFVHPDVPRYDLLTRTLYVPSVPKNQVARICKAALLIVRYAWPHRLRLVRALAAGRDGGAAGKLKVLYASAPLGGLDPDVFHCHFGTIGLLGLRVRQVLGWNSPLVTSFYGLDMTKTVKESGPDIYLDLFENGELFLPIIEIWVDRLLLMGCRPEKIRKHHIGVDCEVFSFHTRPRNPGDSVRIVSIARLVPKKGIEFGLRAVKQLVDVGLDVMYEIVGEGPLASELESLSRRLRLQDRVIFSDAAAQGAVVQKLHRADILIAPSVTAPDGDQEGSPTVLMEAMATGLPVVSTLHSGIPEVVATGRSGFLVPERDVDALAERLEQLCRDASLRACMGQAGRRIVEEEFNIKRLAGQLAAHYRSVVKE